MKTRERAVLGYVLANKFLGQRVTTAAIQLELDMERGAAEKMVGRLVGRGLLEMRRDFRDERLKKEIDTEEGIPGYSITADGIIALARR